MEIVRGSIKEHSPRNVRFHVSGLEDIDIKQSPKTRVTGGAHVFCCLNFNLELDAPSRLLPPASPPRSAQQVQPPVLTDAKYALCAAYKLKVNRNKSGGSKIHTPLVVLEASQFREDPSLLKEPPPIHPPGSLFRNQHWQPTSRYSTITTCGYAPHRRPRANSIR